VRRVAEWPVGRRVQARLLEVVSQLRSQREAREYLRHFARVDAPKFAVILLEPCVPAAATTSVASSLSVLQRFGLFPVVLHGAPGRRGDSVPATPLWPVLRNEALQLVDAIEHAGGRAWPLDAGVFAEPALGASTFAVRYAPVQTAIRLGILPIIPTLAETSGARIFILVLCSTLTDVCVSFWMCVCV
jgi:hypothetical protein